MARWINDGGPGVILETRKEVLVGGMSTFIIFFLYLPVALVLLTYKLASSQIQSSIIVGMIMGVVVTLAVFQWIRSIRSEWNVHKELFLSFPWRKYGR